MHEARFGCAVVAHQGRIYVGGGFGQDKAILCTVESYDPDTDKVRLWSCCHELILFFAVDKVAAHEENMRVCWRRPGGPPCSFWQWSRHLIETFSILREENQCDIFRGWSGETGKPKDKLMSSELKAKDNLNISVCETKSFCWNLVKFFLLNFDN